MLLFALAAALLGARTWQSGTYKPAPTDREILDRMEFRSFLYFWEQSGTTGLVRDRAPADGSSEPGTERIGSIAATGFGLTAICIADSRKWISHEQAVTRVRTTLEFLANEAPVVHGWFYHYMDPETGQRVWNSEISSIDTALLLAGVIFAGERYSDDYRIASLASFIYSRVDFPWMLNGDPYLLSHGWTPESGFIKYRWNEYSELMILYFLGIGSPTHPIPAESWYAWKRPQIAFEDIKFISGGPLFTHQYSQAWIDFRILREKGPHPVDWFENSVQATRAQREFCYKLAINFPSYSADLWGITASDSAAGYTVWGEPPLSAHIDGTVVPSAAGGSLMFAPEITVPVIRKLYTEYGKKLFKRYGFVDAFNPSVGWVARDVVGIDQGIMLLSAENLRSRFVWDLFMRSIPAVNAVERIGFSVEAARPGVWRRWTADLKRWLRFLKPWR